MGDAKSLEGGVLLLTLLQGQDGEIYGRAQGPVSIGGFNIRTIGGDQVRKNYALVGRVPGGMVLEKESFSPNTNGQNSSADSLSLVLNEPDYTTASRLAQVINNTVGNTTATPVDAGEVRLVIPDQFKVNGGVVQFISTVEALEFEPEVRPRVVVNERTGTVVVGQGVTISPVAIAHGNLSVEISVTPVVSQPLPLSQGQTTVVPQAQTQVKNEAANLMVISDGTTVQNVANALNALGVTPRDLIAIFQALAAAGALKAELIIM
jgi:flagellar P-ring protein precursor FlgI